LKGVRLAELKRTYQFYSTKDGSPTLGFGSNGEKMHHSQGALSESIYIYGKAIEDVIIRQWPLRFASIGLGLGYNELLIATNIGIAAKNPAVTINLDKAEIFSFEIEDTLATHFVNWAGLKKENLWTQPLTNAPISSENIFPNEKDFFAQYATISEKISKHYQIPAGLSKSVLKILAEQSQWEIWGNMKTPNPPENLACILFDPFSSGTDPELWEEAFLIEFISRISAPQCVFASYASTGALKRALKQLNFQVQTPHGFAGKREFTFAVRE
jgi:hypothetical protein